MYQNVADIKLRGSVVILINKDKNRLMYLLKDGDRTIYENEREIERKNNTQSYPKNDFNIWVDLSFDGMLCYRFRCIFQ